MLKLNTKLGKLIIFTADAGLLIFFAIPAGAQVIFNNPSALNSTQELVTSIVNWILGIAAAIVIVFLIIGGIYYITASGDEQQIEKAKKILKYCVIGLFVILISYSVVTTLNKIIFG